MAATTKRFDEILAECQPRIYAFIFSLVGNRDLAQEIFQETNLVLVQKSAQFDPVRPFIPWAFAFAKNQVKAALQKSNRDRMLFNEEAMAIVEKIAIENDKTQNARQAALERCIENLKEEQKEIIRGKYQEEKSLEEIAKDRQQKPNRLAVMLFRIRKVLAECISRKLEASHE